MHSPLPLQLATHVEAGAQSAPMYPGSHRHWPFWQTPWWWQSAVVRRTQQVGWY